VARAYGENSEEWMPKRMLKGRLFSRRRKERPHTRCLDNVMVDCVVMGSDEEEEQRAE
jgi:hypothetical protein